MRRQYFKLLANEKTLFRIVDQWEDSIYLITQFTSPQSSINDTLLSETTISEVTGQSGPALNQSEISINNVDQSDISINIVDESEPSKK